MADFKLKVSAETQEAQKNVEKLGKAVDETTKDRQIKIELPNYSAVSKNFSDLKKDIESATNTISQFYRVAGQIPGSPVQTLNEMGQNLKSVAKAANEAKQNTGSAGEVISGTLNNAGKAAETLVRRLTNIAFGLYVVNEAAQAVQQAFGSLFNETIGREIKLRETILKTQTTLASTNKVFKDGKEITDPYQKIVQLTGAVRKNIDSIRERSIALAGVTSNDVIEVFGIVAGQIGQIGGGLKEAEDLAINFSAALGTFGIPLYQARQEIGSILRGDITMDSYLAKALGITNEDIVKAKTQAGGVVKFLEERLAASVAGQRIAAEGFSGVVSNIRDIQELVGQAFGKGLLDPILDGLTKTFDLLFKIRKELLSVSGLVGSSIGTVLSAGAGMVTGASAVSKDPAGRASQALSATQSGVDAVSQKITSAIQYVYLQLATIAERASSAFGAITKGLAALAFGLLSIKLEQLKAVIGLIEAFSSTVVGAANATGGLLAAWGSLMQMPIIQFMAQLNAGMRLLETAGITGVIKSLFILQGVITFFQNNLPRIIAHFNSIRAVIGGIIAAIGALVVNATRAGVALLTAWQPQSKALQAAKDEAMELATQLNIVGNNAQAAGQRLGSLADTGGKLGGGIVGMVANMIRLNIIMFAISATISLVVNLYSKWKEAQDKIASDKRAEEALRRLNTTYRDVGEAASSATKRAKEFEESIVNAKYDEAFENLKKIEAELRSVNQLLDKKNKTTVFDDLQAGTAALLENLGKVWGLMQLIGSAKPIKFKEPEKNKIFGFDVRNLTDEGRAEVLAEKELAARKEVDKWARGSDKSRIEDGVKLEAEKRINLEKEIQDLRRQQENDLFQQRQALAQKELDIFRASGELRIFHMEQANKKMMEGEEGSSAAALEALSNYLTVRERGELEIESAKKQLNIEIANLEKSISDYRLDMEKKIFELRKRAGENDIKSAQLRRQQIEAAAKIVPGGAVKGGAVVTGRNDPDGEQTGSDIVLKGGIGAAIQNPFSSLRITKIGQQGSGSGETGKGFGKYITGEAELNGQKFEVLLGHLNETLVRVGDVLESGAVIGTQGITGHATGPHVSTHVNALNGGNAGAVLKAIENVWVKGGSIQSRSMASNPKTEPLKDALDIGDGSEAIEKYANAVRSVASAMERFRALQQALTEAKTKAAFEAIAKAAFPTVNVEQYTDQIIEAQASLDAYRKVAGQAYDPGLLKIAAEEQAKIAINAKEITQLEEKLKELKLKNRVTTAEQQKLEKDIADRKTKYLQDLKKEREEREKLLKIQREAATVERLAERTRAIPFDIRRAQAQATASMASTYAGDDPVRQRQIQAEQQILEEKIRLEQEHGEGSTVAAAELADFAVKTRAAAVVLGEMDKQVKAFNETMAMIRDISKTMTDGMKGFVKTILTGGDIQEGLKQMLEGMSSKFLDLALDAAFKPMEQQLEAQLKKFFGLEDPKVALQEANNTLLQANTTALQTLNTTIGGSATGQNPAAPTSPSGVTQLPVIPFKEGGSAGNKVTEAEGAYCDALDKATYVKNEESKQGEETTDKQFDFGKALSGATQAFGAVAMGIAGAQQMGKGGTYNTLMGLAGIFGALGSITGMFGTGGIFAAKKNASGGPVRANRPYLVGEIGPELFLPNSDGEIVSNAKSRKLLSAAALAGKSQTFATNAGARKQATPSNLQFDFAYQSEVINNVEYVTTDQFRKGMADSAERGKNMAFQFMQNSVSTRRRLGL